MPIVVRFFEHQPVVEVIGDAAVEQAGLYTMRAPVRGKRDSVMTLTTKGANGKAREVELRRTEYSQPSWQNPRHRIDCSTTGSAKKHALLRVSATGVRLAVAQAIISCCN